MKAIIDIQNANIVTDPHHDGFLQWAWVNGKLYSRRCNTKYIPGKWEVVKRVHITPARVAILNKLINH
jgi:hypothetical protein